MLCWYRVAAKAGISLCGVSDWRLHSGPKVDFYRLQRFRRDNKKHKILRIVPRKCIETNHQLQHDVFCATLHLTTMLHCTVYKTAQCSFVVKCRVAQKTSWVFTTGGIGCKHLGHNHPFLFPLFSFYTHMRPKPFHSLFKLVSTVDKTWSDATGRARPRQVEHCPGSQKACLSFAWAPRISPLFLCCSENYTCIKNTYISIKSETLYQYCGTNPAPPHIFLPTFPRLVYERLVPPLWYRCYKIIRPTAAWRPKFRELSRARAR